MYNSFGESFDTFDNVSDFPSFHDEFNPLYSDAYNPAQPVNKTPMATFDNDMSGNPGSALEASFNTVGMPDFISIPEYGIINEDHTASWNDDVGPRTNGRNIPFASPIDHPLSPTHRGVVSALAGAVPYEDLQAFMHASSGEFIANSSLRGAVPPDDLQTVMTGPTTELTVDSSFAGGAPTQDGFRRVPSQPYTSKSSISSFAGDEVRLGGPDGHPINMKDALEGRAHMDNADFPAFPNLERNHKDGTGNFKPSIRIHWPGYTQMSSQEHFSKRMTKQQLAQKIAKVLNEFIKSHQKELCDHGEWKLGPQGITLDQIFLSKVSYVTQGSVQPEFHIRA